jgi:hypothetical protein
MHTWPSCRVAAVVASRGGGGKRVGVCLADGCVATPCGSFPGLIQRPPLLLPPLCPREAHVQTCLVHDTHAFGRIRGHVGKSLSC